MRPAWWLPRTALVMADVVDQRSRLPVSVSPRAILRNQLKALSSLGITAFIGAELEFYLFRCNWDMARLNGYSGLPPATTKHSQDLLTAEIQEYGSFFAQLAEVLKRTGVDVIASGPEWGMGQWELSIHHNDPLELADELALCKLITKFVAAASNLSVTFMAKPDAIEAGSSCHFHISLTGNHGLPLFYQASAPHKMSANMRFAIGGLLARVPDLMVWYAPTINSYKRTDSTEFAGRGETWGIDNRTTTCRIVGQTRESLRVEFRLPGADVNPYLAIAGVLASIRDGIEHKRVPSEPVIGNAYAQRDVKPHPPTLGDAVDILSGANFACESSAVML